MHRGFVGLINALGFYQDYHRFATSRPILHYPYVETGNAGCNMLNPHEQKELFFQRGPGFLTLEPRRASSRVAPSPKSRRPLRLRVIFPFLAPRGSRRDAVFWKFRKGQGEPGRQVQYLALSDARHHASLRHRAIHHHQNCVAPKSYGLAPNSTALVPSRTASPGSSTAETNNSGSVPSWTSLAVRTIDCCPNTIAVCRHSYYYSSRNPPTPGDPTDSYWRLASNCRFVFLRSC